MPNRIDSNFRSADLINDPIISHPKFSITFEASAKGLSITNGVDEQSLLDGLAEAGLNVPIDRGEVFFGDVRMVKEFIEHRLEASFPDLGVG